mmetsp:Transcript_12578/g.24471  ORF Transcript_12578/g.24471 Transcript_12578/m.24471 type:complete len:103 (+) Transcript_12578:32-340(+)
MEEYHWLIRETNRQTGRSGVKGRDLDPSQAERKEGRKKERIGQRSTQRERDIYAGTDPHCMRLRAFSIDRGRKDRSIVAFLPSLHTRMHAPFFVCLSTLTVW